MSDVEDFLKRVAQMRAEAQARAGQQKQQAQQKRPPQRSAPKPAPQPLAPPPGAAEPLGPRLAQADVVEAELSERSDGVARHVREHLRGSEAIAEHTRNLGAEVDLADDKLEAHLHQVFDHQLGQLRKTTGPVEVKATVAADQGLTLDSIARMLRSPTAARDALILAEIFQRPDHRW